MSDQFTDELADYNINLTNEKIRLEGALKQKTRQYDELVERFNTL